MCVPHQPLVRVNPMKHQTYFVKIISNNVFVDEGGHMSNKYTRITKNIDNMLKNWKWTLIDHNAYHTRA